MCVLADRLGCMPSDLKGYPAREVLEMLAFYDLKAQYRSEQETKGRIKAELM